MTLFGCGPKLAILCLPYIILSLTVMFRYPEFLNMGFLDLAIVKYLGLIWLVMGIIFWIYSAVHFIRYFKPGILITDGPFALSRNPIYSSIIVFIIPSLGLIFHSGIILSIALVLYLGFKLTIHGETIVLRRIFGEEYDRYEKSVNEMLPFPRNIFRISSTSSLQ
jgi:protein-S-isoprenylcysteine O-methyltransferase Ste14